MEEKVIRSQPGFSAVQLRSRAAGRHTGAKKWTSLQKTQTTPDYLTSLFSTDSSVDSSPGSFSPVLPAPRRRRRCGTEVLPADALRDHLVSIFILLAVLVEMSIARPFGISWS